MPYKSKQSALFGNWKTPVTKENRLWYRPKRITVNSKLRQAILDALPFGVTKQQADLALHAIFDVIATTVMRGEKVTIPDLGIFFLQHRPATKRISHLTGQKVGYAKSYVNFEPCRSLMRDLED
jgi:nucleoid DNA-binding protein